MLTSTDIQRITALLRQFGCTARESEMYLHLLHSGATSVQQMAKALGQNRITVHSAVEKLIEHGLAYETRKGKRRMLVAEEPIVLYRLLQKQENELEAVKTNVDHVAKLLASIQRNDRSIPAVKLYEGVNGLKKMLEETLDAKGEVLVFTYVDLFSKLLSPSYLEKYYARRSRKNIYSRLIFPLDEFGKQVNTKAKQYKMQVRFLQQGIAWKSGIFSWNNMIAIQSFTEGKVTCTIIENEDIAHFYRSIIYELCWNQAEELS